MAARKEPPCPAIAAARLGVYEDADTVLSPSAHKEVAGAPCEEISIEHRRISAAGSAHPSADGREVGKLDNPFFAIGVVK